MRGRRERETSSRFSELNPKSTTRSSFPPPPTLPLSPPTSEKLYLGLNEYCGPPSGGAVPHPRTRLGRASLSALRSPPPSRGLPSSPTLNLNRTSLPLALSRVLRSSCRRRSCAVPCDGRRSQPCSGQSPSQRPTRPTSGSTPLTATSRTRPGTSNCTASEAGNRASAHRWRPRSCPRRLASGGWNCATLGG